MIIRLKSPRMRILFLMIVSFIVSYLGCKEAIETTIQYNKLDFNNEISFKITDKYNKKNNGEPFPDLNFKGEVVSTGELIEIKVSKGDFDNHEVGQVIKVYKTTSNEFLTEYEIDNQIIIHIGGFGFSFVFIPTIIFFLVGLLSLYVVLKSN